MNRRYRSLQRGFGLIEILVVVAIIALLAAFVLPRYLSGGTDANGKHVASPKERAKQVEGVAYTSQINAAIQMYQGDHDGQNPPTLQDLKTYGVTSDMLLDPVTHRPLAYDPASGRVGNSNGIDSMGGGANLPQVLK